MFQWHHNERDGVSNHQPHDCLLNSLLFRRRSMETSKLRVTGLCEGNSPYSPHKGASNAENVSFWWRHHDDAMVPTCWPLCPTAHSDITQLCHDLDDCRVKRSKQALALGIRFDYKIGTADDRTRAPCHKTGEYGTHSRHSTGGLLHSTQWHVAGFVCPSKYLSNSLIYPQACVKTKTKTTNITGTS